MTPLPFIEVRGSTQASGIKLPNHLGPRWAFIHWPDVIINVSGLARAIAMEHLK